jgi:hypothetical protein
MNMCCLLLLIAVLVGSSANFLDEVDFLSGLQRLQKREGSDKILQLNKGFLPQPLPLLMHRNNGSIHDTDAHFSMDALTSVLDVTTSSRTTPDKSAQSASFTCLSLPKVYDPHYFCAGVVDYPFIAPTGTTLDAMEVQARTAALYLTSFINAPCLSDMKRLICSSLYQPCVANGKPDLMHRPHYEVIHCRSLLQLFPMISPLT